MERRHVNEEIVKCAGMGSQVNAEQEGVDMNCSVKKTIGSIEDKQEEACMKG